MAITPGMHGEASLTVEHGHTAAAQGSGNVPTLGTAGPGCARRASGGQRGPARPGAGRETVGTAINLLHQAPTSIGKRVRASAEVAEVDGRRVRFTVRAFDASGVIGEGTHERAVVDREQFIWKAASRGV